jgi:hypothetical protein
MRDLVPSSEHGRFFGRRTAATTALSVVAALGGGAIIDLWKSYMPEYAVFGYSLLFLVSVMVGYIGVYLFRFGFGQYRYETLAARPSNSLSRRQWRDFGGRRGNRSDLGRTVRGLLRFAPADISIHLDGRPTEAHGSGTEPSLMDFFLRDGPRTWALLASSPLVCRRTVWRNQAIGLLGRLVRSPPIGSQLVKRRGPAACRSFAAVAFRRLRYTRSRGSASPDAAELLRDSRVAFACGSRHSRRGGARESAINFVLRPPARGGWSE